MLDVFESPGTVGELVAKQVKQRRLEKRLTQQELAQRAGLTLATYRRFEQTAQISFTALLQIGFALDCLDDFRNLFATPTWASIEDMQNNSVPRQRIRHD